VVAGPVLGLGKMEKVGPNKDITVPPMFFKILIREGEEGVPAVLAFLLPHHKEPHGEIQDYLVSVDIIEAMTDLDFFRELDEATEDSLEAVDTWKNWDSF
jgi:endonuclease G